jgi:hypothetical protein
MVHRSPFTVRRSPLAASGIIRRLKTGLRTSNAETQTLNSELQAGITVTTVASVKNPAYDQPIRSLSQLWLAVQSVARGCFGSTPLVWKPLATFSLNQTLIND